MKKKLLLAIGLIPPCYYFGNQNDPSSATDRGQQSIEEGFLEVEKVINALQKLMLLAWLN